MLIKPQFLTIPQTAELLNCAVQTVRNLISRKRLSAIKIDGSKGDRSGLRISIRELNKYLKQQGHEGDLRTEFYSEDFIRVLAEEIAKNIK